MRCYQQIAKIAWVIGSIFFLFLSPAYAQDTKIDEIAFLSLADFHFDPFVSCRNKVPCPLIQKLQNAPVEKWPQILKEYDKDKAQYLHDSNYTLLVSALEAAKKVAENRKVKFVVILGDFLAHEFRDNYKKYTGDNSFSGHQAFVRKTLLFVNNEIAKTFPTLDVYSVLGNNDSYHRDYVTISRGQFLKDAGAAWSLLIKTPINRQIMQKEFPVNGYYAVDAPGVPGLRLISLNTVLFSYKARMNDKAAVEELAWLKNELKSAELKKQKVLILMHIPSGVDIYATLKVRFFRLVNLWNIKYTTQFEDDLKEYAPEMVGILSGHLHSDWSQILTLDNAHSIPISGTSSISPIFGNNPGFKVYIYSIPKQQLEYSDSYIYPMDKENTWNVIYRYNQFHSNPLEEMNAQLA